MEGLVKLVLWLIVLVCAWIFAAPDSAPAGQAYSVARPPAQWVYRGRPSFHYLPAPFQCPLGGFGYVLGCSHIGPAPTCEVWLPSNLTADGLTRVRRHELAHCAGWPADHPGGVPEWVR